MTSLQADPVGFDFTDGDSVMDGSQTSTKSSKERKLRQVLQKKQLDVLLETYSSVMEESLEINKTSSDLYSISRKKSIEANLPAVLSDDSSIAAEMQKERNALLSEEKEALSNIRRNRKPDLDVDPILENRSAKTVESNLSRSRSQQRKSKMISEDGDSVTGNRHQEDPPSVTEMMNRAAASRKKKERAMKEASQQEKEKETIRQNTFRQNKKKLHKNRSRSKKQDFTTRLLKAGEIMSDFATRATQKHFEIAADFQETSREFSYQLKNGANVAFEDLADQFDGMVENLFVNGGCQKFDGETGLMDAGERDLGNNEEHRDDSGNRPETAASAGLRRPPRPEDAGHNQAYSLVEEKREANQPLSHEETIYVMGQQVSDIIEPVADSVQNYTNSYSKCISCLQVAAGKGIEENNELLLTNGEG